VDRRRRFDTWPTTCVLLTETVFEELLRQLGPVVHLKTRDEAAAPAAEIRSRHRQRLPDESRPSLAAIASPQITPTLAARAPAARALAARAPRPRRRRRRKYERFGLMASFVAVGQRLPQALATGGEHVQFRRATPNWCKLTRSTSSGRTFP
jgi:hypothetical protein